MCMKKEKQLNVMTVILPFLMRNSIFLLMCKNYVWKWGEATRGKQVYKQSCRHWFIQSFSRKWTKRYYYCLNRSPCLTRKSYSNESEILNVLNPFNDREKKIISLAFIRLPPHLPRWSIWAISIDHISRTTETIVLPKIFFNIDIWSKQIHFTFWKKNSQYFASIF